ncbi:MAG: DUF6783 domain-containing protein [Lachnospiraceae bacterium]
MQIAGMIFQTRSSTFQNIKSVL